ncbi:MAG: metal-dependent hydrolase [Bacteroidota bacterium]
MDSLTQLTLGAAVGEAVLGKKVGNRAMVWGAFGGLLPDFDVFARFFTDEITALAFHRGAMHSVLFSIFAALILAWMVEWLYRSNVYRRKRYKGLVTVFIFSIYTLLILGMNMIFNSPNVLIGGVIGGAVIGWFLWTSYLRKDLEEVSASRAGWFWLFFLSIVTHPILDCFTTYGTQILWPFSDARVSWDNISVADPLYTIPLFLGVLIASFISRHNNKRHIINWAGIVISSLYMAFTFYHKAQFNKIFEKSMVEQGIEFNRYMSGPTILQNFLWLGVAEDDDYYYHGYYSFFNKEPNIQQFSKLPKNHEWVAHLNEERAVKILKWFSKGYWNVIKRNDGRLQMNDLRYGSFNGEFEKENDYIFKFILSEENGELKVDESREGRDVNGDALKEYFDRVFGRI